MIDRPRAPFLLFVAVVLGSGILACSGGDQAVVIRDEEGPTPTPADTRKALNEALQAFNDYCLAPDAQGNEPYPIALVNPGTSTSSYRYRQMAALREAGLLDTTVTQSDGGLPVHRFDLTKTGRASQYEIARGQGYENMFCYAIPRVTQIDSIKAIYNAGPNALARVWYSYGYQDQASWVESPGVQRSFSGLNPLPSPQARRADRKLLVRVDSAWVDRRLTGYDRPPERPAPPAEQ